MIARSRAECVRGVDGVSLLPEAADFTERVREPRARDQDFHLPVRGAADVPEPARQRRDRLAHGYSAQNSGIFTFRRLGIDKLASSVMMSQDLDGVTYDHE